MEEEKWTINNYNQQLDYTKIINWKGANGISYRYFLKHGANPFNFHVEAADVRSIKGDNTRPSRSKRHWGKVYKPGQYQPLGDPRWFLFYQENKMTEQDKIDWFLEYYEKILRILLGL
jgi:hypothetical protein